MKFGRGKSRSRVEYSTLHWAKTRMARRQQERANIACSGGVSYNYLARSSSGALAKEMAQWLRGLAALPEELGSIPHNSLYF